jgi:hypothetical protein
LRFRALRFERGGWLAVISRPVKLQREHWLHKSEAEQPQRKHDQEQASQSLEAEPQWQGEDNDVLLNARHPCASNRRSEDLLL